MLARAAGGANYKLKVPKGATRLGNGLAVVGTGLGIWADMNDGESTGRPSRRMSPRRQLV